MKLVGSFVCLSMLWLPSSSSASTPSTKNAQRATYNQINNEVANREAEGIASDEKSEIKCSRLTGVRYHCVFHFSPFICGRRGYERRDYGYSYVTFRRYGAEVDLHLTQANC